MILGDMVMCYICEGRIGGEEVGMMMGCYYHQKCKDTE
jgi:hypothetical protein